MSSESSSDNKIGLVKEDPWAKSNPSGGVRGLLSREPWAKPKTDDGVLGLSERIVTIGVGPDDFEILENPGLPLDELTGSGDGGKDPN